MEQFPNQQVAYPVDDFDGANGSEHGDVPSLSGGSSIDYGSSGSDFDDDVELNDPRTDTSAAEARNGKDIQGIPWERLNFTRDKYRECRLKQYKNYESLPHSLKDLEKKCKEVEKGHIFYDFQFSTRSVKSTIVHFQLRNLLWATSKHDVYLVQNYSVMHWSSLLRRATEVLNVANPIKSASEQPGVLAQILSNVQISTIAVKNNLLVAGGFYGELICKYLNQPGIALCTNLVSGENAITNSVEIYHNPGGSMRVMTANNDAEVRILDTETFSCLNHFKFPWCVNNTSVSPDGNWFAIVGDSPDCLIANAETGKIFCSLKGHLDFSFASAWHPDGWILATGNQDTTCRLWDIRKFSQSFAILKGRMGAIRSLRFTSDGRYLAMAEPADFVHGSMHNLVMQQCKRSISSGRLLESPSALIMMPCS